MTRNDINALESESGIIATLLHHPEYILHSEQLLPNHFTNRENALVYGAIRGLTEKGIYTADAYNIIQQLDSTVSTQRIALDLTVEKLNELIDMSDELARHSIAEYNIAVHNVLDAAFRRDTLQALRECENLCYQGSRDEVQQSVYEKIDDVMTEYSTTDDTPPFRDVVDSCWKEIQSRQQSGYAGIPFKFKTLNEFATIERGELFIFAAEAKQGKSMMLLNCAVDLLCKDKAVLYIDSELNTRLFTARILAYLSGIEYKRLVSGNYSSEEEQKIKRSLAWIKTKKFTHIYLPIFDEQTIYTAVKRVSHTQGLDVLIIDYFKSSGVTEAYTVYAEMGRFVDMVKNKICGDMNIAGIGAAQATVTGKVADSAKIGRNASTIAVIQNKTPEEIEADGEECGNKKMRIVLNRNGPQHADGEYIDMWFNGSHVSYEEARQHIPQMPY